LNENLLNIKTGYDRRVKNAHLSFIIGIYLLNWATGTKAMPAIGANVVKIGVRTRVALAAHNDEYFSMSHDAIAVVDEVIVESVDGEVYRVGLLHRRHLWLVTAISTGGGSRGGRHFRLEKSIAS
jgi:hypothetical protein